MSCQNTGLLSSRPRSLGRFQIRVWTDVCPDDVFCTVVPWTCIIMQVQACTFCNPTLARWFISNEQRMSCEKIRLPLRSKSRSQQRFKTASVSDCLSTPQFLCHLSVCNRNRCVCQCYWVTKSRQSENKVAMYSYHNTVTDSHTLQASLSGSLLGVLRMWETDAWSFWPTVSITSYTAGGCFAVQSDKPSFVCVGEGGCASVCVSVHAGGGRGGGWGVACWLVFAVVVALLYTHLYRLYTRVEYTHMLTDTTPLFILLFFFLSFFWVFRLHPLISSTPVINTPPISYPIIL